MLIVSGVKVLGKRIQQARLRAGLTQQQLARLANTSERNIVRWENNQNAPRLEHLAAVASATGADVQDFFDPDDDAEAASMASATADSLAYALRVEIRTAVRNALREETAA